MSRYLIVVTAILLSTYSYVASRLLTGGSLLIMALLGALLALPWIWFAWLPFVYWREDEDAPETGLSRFLQWGAYVGMASASFLLFSTVTRDLLWLASRILHQDPDPLRWYGGSAALAVVGFAFLGVALGAWGARSLPAVQKVEVPLDGLPEEFDGFQIAQISDLHIGTTIGRHFVQGVVEAVNALQADLIALTGDIGDGMPEILKDAIAPLSGLKAREGSVFVTGNHEYYWNAKEWIAAMEGQGIEPLLNRHRSIQRGTQTLVVAGIPDLWSGKANPKQALHGAPSGSRRILLAHQPGAAREAEAAGFDLQLSGHTHGGQFVPWTWVARLVHRPVLAGLGRVGKMWLYVSRGTGTWGPPVRLGAPSEITLVTLRKAAQPL